VIAIIGDQFDVGTWWCWELLCDRPTLVITFADIMNVYLGLVLNESQGTKFVVRWSRSDTARILFRSGVGPPTKRM
jgi:hypothetical protein